MYTGPFLKHPPLQFLFSNKKDQQYALVYEVLNMVVISTESRSSFCFNEDCSPKRPSPVQGEFLRAGARKCHKSEFLLDIAGLGVKSSSRANQKTGLL